MKANKAISSGERGQVRLLRVCLEKQAVAGAAEGARVAAMLNHRLNMES